MTTITSVGAHELVSASLIQYHTEQSEQVRANQIDAPLPTVDTSNRYGLIAANLVEYFQNGRPLPINEPMHTVTTREREALVAAHVVEFKGQDKGQSCAEPLRTITASVGEFGLCETVIVRADGERDFGYWPRIRELLNQYCGYSLAQDEILLLVLDGVVYYIRDILLRMLAPKELYAAMGFPPDYIIERDCTGKAYPRSAQVARCGNAVCPPMASAVVRANFPEWASDLRTMEELNRQIAS